MAGLIEFVEPDAGDEPEREPASPPPARRRAALLVALVAAVVLGLLVARSVSSGGRHDEAAPTSTPTASSSLTTPSVSDMMVVLDAHTGEVVASICPGDPVVPDGVPPAGLQSDAGGTLVEQNDARCTQDASVCPKARPCVTSTDLPPAVLATVHRRFPSAQLALARTETLRSTGRLWYRLLVFTLAHSTTLRVDVVQRTATRPESGERESGSGLFTRTVHQHGGLVTLVTAGAPTGSPPTLAAQLALARDPALLTLP